MVNRKKRLKKAIESLKKRVSEHLEKVAEEKRKPNYDYALVMYWEKEIKQLRLGKKEKEKLLKKAK